MYKLLYQNKIIIFLALLCIVYISYKIYNKNSKILQDKLSESSSSSIILQKKEKTKNTTSILPDPRKRIQNIHNDIKYLQHLTNNRNDEHIRLITKYDKEPENYFINLCKEKKIKFDKQKLSNLVKYIENISKVIKNKYKIPRPYQLAKKLNLNINNLAKPSTFSYPCGKVLKSKILSH